MLAFLFITENFYFLSGIIGSPQAFNRFQIIPESIWDETFGEKMYNTFGHLFSIKINFEIHY